MVVGVRKSLEEGRRYSYDELRERFGLVGTDLERVLDHLVERGRLKPVFFSSVQRAGRPVLACATRERQVRWEA